MHARGFALFTAAIAAGLIGDIAFCSFDTPSPFWLHLLPNLYYVGILYSAITYGIKGGLGAAALAGLCHAAAVTSACRRPVSEQGELAAFVLIAMIAAWLTQTRTRISSSNGEKISYNDVAIERSLEQTAWSRAQAPIAYVGPGFAHQFFTPLASIEGAAYVLEDEKLPREKRQEFVGIIQRECHRLDELLRSSGLGRARTPDAERVAAFSLLEQVARSMQEQRECAIRVHAATTGRSLYVYGNPERMAAALVALATRSAPAMRHGREITLSLRSDQGSAIIGIHDQRGSEQAEHLQKIYETYGPKGLENITPDTAEAVRTIVNHGGEVRIARRGNTGTTLEVILPAFL